MKKPFYLSLAVMIGGVYLASLSMAKDPKVIPPEMTGEWKGEAQSIMTWTKTKKIKVTLQISEDGSVHGNVGDAKLVKGKFKKNRGAIGKKLNIKTDYIIRGELQGAILKSEGISRKQISIPLNYKEGVFTGGFATNGKKFGDKKTGILSASNLTVKK